MKSTFTVPSAMTGNGRFNLRDRPLRVYLLGGQSNMVGVASVTDLPPDLLGAQRNVLIHASGEIPKENADQWMYLRPGLGVGHSQFGPELTFGRDLAAAYPGENIALIKCAWGGTNLHSQWRPPSAGGEVGALYRDFVESVKNALARLEPGFLPQIVGMIWMQGEADALDEQMASPYERNLTYFIHDIRAELGLPDLLFVIGQIADAPVYRPPMWGTLVREAQENVSRKVPGGAMFSTSDYHLIDPWHYDAAGMISLGSRFAKALVEFESRRAHRATGPREKSR